VAAVFGIWPQWKRFVESDFVDNLDVLAVAHQEVRPIRMLPRDYVVLGPARLLPSLRVFECEMHVA